MALPVASVAPAAKGTAVVLSKGVALVKGLSASKLAKAGVGVVSATKFAKSLSNKEKSEIKKEAKKAGIKIDFDLKAKNTVKTDIRISNKGKSKGVAGGIKANPIFDFNFALYPQKEMKNKSTQSASSKKKHNTKKNYNSKNYKSTKYKNNKYKSYKK